MSVIFRVATASDAAGIHQLIDSLAHHRSLDLSEPAPAGFTTGFAVATLEANLADSRYVYGVAVAGSRIVGVLGIRDGNRIQHLFVDERYQRQGIASELWKRAQDSLDDSGGITVRSSLHAVPVYERFGFVLAGTVVNEPGLTYVSMELKPKGSGT